MATQAVAARIETVRSLPRHRPRRLKGIRRYPFGGIAKTCAWFWHVAEGRFEDPRDGRGFRLAEPLAAAAYLDPP